MSCRVGLLRSLQGVAVIGLTALSEDYVSAKVYPKASFQNSEGNERLGKLVAKFRLVKVLKPWMDSQTNRIRSDYRPKIFDGKVWTIIALKTEYEFRV